MLQCSTVLSNQKSRFAVIRGILFLLCCIILVQHKAEAQPEFMRGTYLFGYEQLDITQLKDTLHLEWLQGLVDNYNGSTGYLLNNTGNLKLIGISKKPPNITEDMSSAQRMVFEAEQPPDPSGLKNYFNEKPSGQIDQFDPSLLISSGSAGYMVKSPLPNNEYHYQRTHYTASFILKRAPAASGNPPVVTLEAVCEVNGSILKSRTLYHDHFSSNDLETKTLEFELEYDPNVFNKPFGVMLGQQEAGNPSLLCTGVDIRVYWHGEVTVWLDKVIIEDDLGKGLFAGQYDQGITNIASYYKNNWPNKMLRFYLRDEPYVSAFLSQDYVNKKLEVVYGPDPVYGKGSGLTAYNGWGYQRFLSDAQPQDLFIDPYTITTEIPSPAITNNHADSVGIANYQSDHHYNVELQMRMQYPYIEIIRGASTAVKNKGKRFYVIPQLHGTYFEKNGEYNKPSGGVMMRPPTGNEVKLQCNLAIAYGASGLLPFILVTSNITWNEEGKAYFAGLISDTEVNGVKKNHWTNYDEFPYQTGQNPGQTAMLWVGYKDKWDALVGVYEKMKNISPVYMSLEWQKAYSIHVNQPVNEYITNIQSCYIPYLEGICTVDPPSINIYRIGIIQKS